MTSQLASKWFLLWLSTIPPQHTFAFPVLYLVSLCYVDLISMVSSVDVLLGSEGGGGVGGSKHQDAALDELGAAVLQSMPLLHRLHV